MTDDDLTTLGADSVTDSPEQRELTDTEMYQGELAGDLAPAEADLRPDETSDPTVAAQEGLAYVPPTDPPVVHDPQGDEMEARVREALRADAATSRYAEELVIGTRGGVVGVRGVVDDIDDTDDVTEVISRVPGVDEVVDELDVKGLTD